MSDDLYELYKRYFPMTPVIGCINCQRLGSDVKRLRAALLLIKSSVYGDPCTENNVESLALFIDELRDIARKVLQETEGAE